MSMMNLAKPSASSGVPTLDMAEPLQEPKGDMRSAPAKKGKKDRKGRKSQALAWDTQSEATTLVGETPDSESLDLKSPAAQKPEEIVPELDFSKDSQKELGNLEPEAGPETVPELSGPAETSTVPEVIGDSVPEPILQSVIEGTVETEHEETPSELPTRDSNKSEEVQKAGKGDKKKKRKKGKNIPAWDDFEDLTSIPSVSQADSSQELVSERSLQEDELASKEISSEILTADPQQPQVTVSNPQTPKLEPSRFEEEMFYTPEKGRDDKSAPLPKLTLDESTDIFLDTHEHGQEAGSSELDLPLQISDHATEDNHGTMSFAINQIEEVKGDAKSLPNLSPESRLPGYHLKCPPKMTSLKLAQRLLRLWCSLSLFKREP